MKNRVCWAVLAVTIIFSCQNVYAIKCFKISGGHPLGFETVVMASAAQGEVVPGPSGGKNLLASMGPRLRDIWERYLNGHMGHVSKPELNRIEDWLYKITPVIFRARGDRYEVNRPENRGKRVRKYAREKMDEGEALDILRYIERMSNYNLETAKLEKAFPRFLVRRDSPHTHMSANGRATAVFDIGFNIKEGMMILREYDWAHGSSFTHKAGLTLIRNMDTRGFSSFHLVSAIDSLVLATYISRDRYAIRDLFSAMAGYVQPWFFFRSSEMNKYFYKMIRLGEGREAEMPETSDILVLHKAKITQPLFEKENGSSAISAETPWVRTSNIGFIQFLLESGALPVSAEQRVEVENIKTAIKIIEERGYVKEVRELLGLDSHSRQAQRSSQ